MPPVLPRQARPWPPPKVLERAPGSLLPFTAVRVVARDGAVRPGEQRVLDAVLPRGAHRRGATLTVEMRRQAPVRTGGRRLPAEGFRLEVSEAASGPRAVLTSADDAGRRYGVLALADLVEPGPAVPETCLSDWPALPWRGTVEGFYGRPWTHEDRLEHLRFSARHRLNHYVYAPKDDPFHRDRWREPYPAEELARVAELVEVARAEGVAFVFAVAPGLSMRYSDDSEHARLASKARQLQAVGVQDWALLFDDIPAELQHAQDVARFGAGTGRAGAAHGLTCARFQQAVVQGQDGPGRLFMVPVDYAGSARSAYRDELARTLPPDVPVWWTGEDVVVGEVTRGHLEGAADAFGRDLLLWDNFPVNDFDPARVFLGPLVGRSDDLAGTRLLGISANPMVEAAPSQLALATVARWAWDPAAYDPAEAAAGALADVAGPLAEGIGPLVEACSAWPPGAPQHPRLRSLCCAALDGDLVAREELRAGLEGLAAVPAVLGQAPPGLRRLAEQLRPWGAAGAAMAAAGLAALDLLVGGEPAAAEDVAEVRGALDAAEEHYENVLRDVVPPFVRAVLLARDGADAEGDGSGRPVALVLLGPEPGPGDLSLVPLLQESGFTVRTGPPPAPPHEDVGMVEDADLVVVSSSAGADQARRAARCAAPVLAWARLVELGLATASGALVVQDRLEVTEEGRRLGVEPGPCTVYRGPGTVRWGEPGPAGVVLARSREGRPALTHYPPGSPLPDGTEAPAARTALFLGREGMAPWLITAAGRALVEGALRLALAGQRART